jgi:hypothetical protein
LGKKCGVELHLPELVDAIHEVPRSDLIAPYLESNEQKVCQFCAYTGSEICPCPLRYLAVLIVEAVEAVDQRHQEQATLV